jgi:hypothetical protein
MLINKNIFYLPKDILMIIKSIKSLKIFKLKLIEGLLEIIILISSGNYLKRLDHKKLEALIPHKPSSDNPLNPLILIISNKSK